MLFDVWRIKQRCFVICGVDTEVQHEKVLFKESHTPFERLVTDLVIIRIYFLLLSD